MVIPELPYAQALRESAEAGDAKLLLGIKTVSKILNRNVDSASIDTWLDDLALKVTKRGRSVEGVLAVCREHGFRGTTDKEFHEYCNSDIAHVLESRRGIAISLAMILIGICERLALTAQGVNFPGVFLVQIEDQVVDPVNLVCLDYDAFCEKFRRRKIRMPSVPDIAANKDILKRVFRNLHDVAVSKGDIARRLEFMDYMQLVAPDDWFVYFTRAEVRVNVGDIEAAILDLKTARTLNLDCQIVEEIDKALAKLGKLSTQKTLLH